MPFSRIALIFLSSFYGIFACTLTGCSSSRSQSESANLEPNKTQDGDTDIRRAQVAYNQKNFDEAISLLESAVTKPLKLYSKSTVYSMLGDTYDQLGQFEKSLQCHDKAIQVDPENFQPYMDRGVIFRRLKRYDQAETSYTRALELKPDSAKLHTSIGALAIYQEKFDKAVQHLELALQLDDSVAVCHSNLALAYAAIGRFSKAQDSLEQATKLGYHKPEVIQARIDKLRSLANRPVISPVQNKSGQDKTTKVKEKTEK